MDRVHLIFAPRSHYQQMWMNKLINKMPNKQIIERKISMWHTFNFKKIRMLGLRSRFKRKMMRIRRVISTNKAIVNSVIVSRTLKHMKKGFKLAMLRFRKWNKDLEDPKLHRYKSKTSFKILIANEDLQKFATFWWSFRTRKVIWHLVMIDKMKIKWYSR